jgi:type I restriction enzyme S subunit
MNNSKFPTLRFPGFVDEWKVKKLKDRCTFFSGGTPTSTNKEYYNGKIPFIGSGNIFDEKVDKFITEEALLNSSAKIVEKGDILYALYGANSGDVSLSNIQGAINQAILCIRTKEEKDFLHQLLSYKKGNIVSTYLQGGQGNLSSDIIKKLKLNFPNLQEQQKIASFLTDIDDKITKLTKKKKLIEQYKRGIMQKIFSQELRFKDDDGNAFPDWEERPLGDLCSKAQSGGTPKSTKKSYYNGNIPFLSISDMTSQGKYLKETKKTISELGLDNSSSWLVPKGSLIYSMYASVGFVSINKIEIATSQAVMNIILKDGHNIEYIYYFLVDFQKSIKKYIETGTQGNINASIVKSFLIALPNIKEQIKIANFLSDIDLKIAVLNTKIENTQTFKKGLLQKMFV